jgi:hypothetical protein
LSYEYLDSGKSNLSKWTATFSFAVPTRAEAANNGGPIRTAADTAANPSTSEKQRATLRGATADFANSGEYNTLTSKQDNFFDGKPHSLSFNRPTLRGTGDIVLQLCIDDPATGKTCWPFAIKHHPTIFSSTIAYEIGAVIGLCTLVTALFIFRPITYLQLYEAPYLSAVLEFKVAGMEIFKPLVSLIALPYLAFHRRSLEAWLSTHYAELRANAWKQELMVLPGEYIPLPTNFVSSQSNAVILRPTDDVLMKLFRSEGTIVQITGPGGVGKTSLCKHLCELFLDQERIHFSSCPYPLIMDGEFSDLATTVQQKLGLLTGVKVSSQLSAALLREGLVQVVIDGVSEKSDALRNALVAAVGAASVRQVILTSRSVLTEFQGRSVQCEPQPLETDNLLFFIGKLVSDARAERGDSIDGEQQLVIAAKISKMIRRSGEGLTLTPLLAKLIVEKALRTKSVDPSSGRRRPGDPSLCTGAPGRACLFRALAGPANGAGEHAT